MNEGDSHEKDEKLSLPRAPVGLRNALYARDPVLISANGGINLFIGTEPKYRGVIGVRPGPEFSERPSCGESQ